MKKLSFFLMAMLFSVMSFAADVTISFANANHRLSQDNNSQVWQNSGVTFTNAKANSSNAVVGNTNPIRCYANSKITVEAPGSITKLVFDCNSGSYATALKNSVGNEASVSNDIVTITPTSASDTYVIAKLTAQVRIDQLTVTYTESGAAETVVANPIFSLAGGEYEGAQNVKISCSTVDATIYYTTNGEVPSQSSNVYSDPITISESTTIKAYAVKNGLEDSEIVEAVYTITEGPDAIIDFTSNDAWKFPADYDKTEKTYSDGTYTVVVNAASNGHKYQDGKLLLGKKDAYLVLPAFSKPVEKIACPAVSGASGKVTWNVFDGDNAVSQEVTACNIDQSFKIDNPAANKVYTIKITNENNLQISHIKIYFGEAAAVAKPYINGDAEFIESTEVTISAEEGLKVYYTLDGTDPTNESTEYTAPFTVTATTTVKAVAYDGETASEVSSKTFKKLQVLTCAEAKALCTSTQSSDKYVIRGYITSIPYAYSSSNNNITFWMADTKNGGQVFEGYKAVPVKEADKSVKVGDYVELIGNIVLYGTTAETAQGGLYTIIPAPVVYHTITVEANNTDWGTVAGGATVAEGEDITVTATPATGCNFVNWTVNDEEVSDEKEYTFTVTEALTLVANFEQIQYNVTATVNPAEAGTVEGVGPNYYGTEARLTAISNEGYTFLNWTVGEKVVTENPYSFNVYESVDVVANFEALSATKYTVTLINPTDLAVGFTGDGEYEEGAEATVVATLADEYMVFAYWKNDATDEIVSYNTSYTFTVTEDITLSAHYASGGMTETITNLTIDTESFPSFMGVLTGGPGSDWGFSVMLAISEYDDATASFILAPESSVMRGEEDCDFVKGHVSYLDASTVEATAHIVVVYSGELLAIDLDMSFVAEEILPTEVIVTETTLSVEFGALLMKGVWNNPEDGLDYPFTATIGGWNCQLAEAEVLTSITIGGEGEDDPWLGFSEGRMTLTNEDGFLTLTGTPTAYTGPTVKVTAHGQAMIMEMDVDATITVVEDVYLKLNGTDKNSGIEVDLYLDNYTGQDKTYQLNEASTVMSGEIAVYGEITKDGDTYSGVAYAETEEGFYVFPMTLTEFVPEYTMITMDNLQAQVEERDLGWGGLTYTVLMAEGTWSDGEETYPVLLEVTDYDPTITSGIAPISLTIGGMGDDDPWLGSVTDAEVEFTTEGNTITFTGKIANTYAWPAPIYWDIHITATIAPANETVYFVNALNWTNVHAYAWTTDPNASWPGAEATLEATTIADYEVYSYTAPAGTYAYVIFNGDQGQTDNLVWTAGKYYVVDEWYTREEVEEQLAKLVWTMVGTPVLFGSDWDTSDIKNDMVRQPDGSFQLTLNNLTLSAGTYEYKAVKGHNWGIEIPGGGSGNASLTIGKDGIYNITFTINKEETELTHQIELVEEVVVLPTVAIAGAMNGWSTDAHIMVDNANGTASVQVLLEANTEYEFKVVENGNWLGNAGTMDSGNCTGWVFATGESNAKILSGKAGQYTFTWNYDKDELTVTYPTTTGLGNLDASVAPVKVIENGQLIIIKNGVRYNATGAIVK